MEDRLAAGTILSMIMGKVRIFPKDPAGFRLQTRGAIHAEEEVDATVPNHRRRRRMTIQLMNRLRGGDLKDLDVVENPAGPDVDGHRPEGMPIVEGRGHPCGLIVDDRGRPTGTRNDDFPANVFVRPPGQRQLG